MYVLVRIDVRGIFARQSPENVELAQGLIPERCRFVECYNVIDTRPLGILINPFSKVEVQSQAKTGLISGVIRGFDCGLPSNHQAGAGNDAMFMRIGDAAIHLEAVTEIIRVYDQISLRHFS